MRKSFIQNEFANEIKSRYLSGESAYKLGKEYKICSTTIYNFLEKEGIQRRENSDNSRRFKFDFDYFEKIDSEEKAYILGFIYADGCMSKVQNYIRIIIHSKDIDVLEKINKSLGSNYPIKKVKGKDHVDLTLCSKKTREDLGKLGCLPNKTYHLDFPDINPSLKRHFIRGFFDGDGCFTFSLERNRFSVKIVCTFEMSDALTKIVKDELEIDAKSYVISNLKRAKLKSFEIQGMYKCHKFLDFIYNNANIFLKRKKEKYEEVYANL
jgi:hypothetical protein